MANPFAKLMGKAFSRLRGNAPLKPGPLQEPHRPKSQRQRHGVRAFRFWSVTLPDGAHWVFDGETKSEARANAKKELGLHGRLPIGTVVTAQ
jgi:hypothetical protein